MMTSTRALETIFSRIRFENYPYPNLNIRRPASRGRAPSLGARALGKAILLSISLKKLPAPENKPGTSRDFTTKANPLENFP